MIKVGINQNVFIAEAKVVVAEKDATKSRLVIDFRDNEDEAPASSGDLLSDLNSSEEEGLESSGLSIFPFDNQVDAGKEFTAEIAKQRIEEVKGPLNHILLGYMTKTEIRWDIFKGIPVTADTASNMLLQNDVLRKIYDNIVEQFIQMLTPRLAGKKKFRFLAIRQSAKKHYPALRKRFLKENPFWESMEIPDNQSKLKFNNYEISKGLNHDIPVPTDDATESASSGAGAGLGIGTGLGMGTREE